MVKFWSEAMAPAAENDIGPGRGRMLDHVKPNDHRSGTSHCDLGSVRSRKIRWA